MGLFVFVCLFGRLVVSACMYVSLLPVFFSGFFFDTVVINRHLYDHFFFLMMMMTMMANLKSKSKEMFMCVCVWIIIIVNIHALKL